MPAAASPATCFLLAAGLGTRLRPLTNLRPKALVPVGGVPMLDHALALARHHGHTQVIVNAHHLWQQVAAWAERQEVDLQVELPEVLGTGGGLRAALDRLDEVVAVVNADILCDVDLTALVGEVPEGGAAMALRPAEEAAAIGEVEADEEGVVRRITTVVGIPGTGLPGTHFTGIHAMHRDAVERVPADGLQCVVRTAYKELVPQGRVRSIRHEGTWIDIGTPGRYLDANLAVLRGEVHAPVDPWSRGRRVGEGSLAGPGAVVEGEVTDTVVGAGAVVPAGAVLSDCVVWSGATVPPGRHHRRIFADEGVVVDA